MANRSNFKIEEVVEHPKERTEKVVIWDADSLIYHALWQKDEETGVVREYTENDLEELQLKLNEMIYKTLNNIEEFYDIRKLYLFIRGRNNYRKRLYEPYKANRPPTPALTYPLFEYLQIAWDAIESYGFESEDYVYTCNKKIGYNGIIVYVDHDLEESHGLFYNYQKHEWKKISEKQALYNKYKKLTIGESGDNVNLSPKIGISYFTKNFNIDFTIEQYEEQLLKAYIKAWKDEIKAKEMLELAKDILLLQDIETSKFRNG